MRLLVKSTVQDAPDEELQLPTLHPPKLEVPVAVAVNVTRVPLTKLALHGVGLVQIRPCGELVTSPEPTPAKFTVSIGPVVLRQATFAVIELLMIAPDEGRFPTL